MSSQFRILYLADHKTRMSVIKMGLDLQVLKKSTCQIAFLKESGKRLSLQQKVVLRREGRRSKETGSESERKRTGLSPGKGQKRRGVTVAGPGRRPASGGAAAVASSCRRHVTTDEVLTASWCRR